MKNIYFGFSSDSEFLQWKWEKLVDYIAGQLIISIGQGTFRSSLYTYLQWACGWALYQEDKKKEKK